MILIALGILFLGVVFATAGGTSNGRGLGAAFLESAKSWRVLSDCSFLYELSCTIG